MKKVKRIYSRPRDKSLQAFKDFLNSVGEFLGAKDDLTEEEWVKAWKEFWAK